MIKAVAELRTARLGAPFRAVGERPELAAEGRAGRPVDLRGVGDEGLGQDRLRAGNV